jgi:translation initiation factor IF-3
MTEDRRLFEEGSSKDDGIKGVRTNFRIKAPEVRVIGENGEMIGVMTVKQAVSLAQERGLDLVEINPKAIPPVCKITDFGKFKYERKKKEREARKRQTVVEIKEIKFRPTTDDHDIEVKTKNIRRFLEDKNRVKLTIRFRGRELAHQEIGKNVLLKVAEMISDAGVIMQEPRADGKQMTMIIAPKDKDKDKEKEKENE